MPCGDVPEETPLVAQDKSDWWRTAWALIFVRLSRSTMATSRAPPPTIDNTTTAAWKATLSGFGTAPVPRAEAVVLYIDVETNGPIPRKRTAKKTWPCIVQLAFQVVKGGDAILQRFDTYVSLPARHKWSTSAFRCNGITQEQLARDGMPVADAIGALRTAIDTHHVNIIVAHNLHGFDAPVVLQEVARTGGDVSSFWQSAELRCTMTDPRILCYYGGKQQSLANAFALLHGRPWDGAALHNAISDVECLRKLHERADTLGVWEPMPAAPPRIPCICIRPSDIGTLLGHNPFRTPASALVRCLETHPMWRSVIRTLDAQRATHAAVDAREDMLASGTAAEEAVSEAASRILTAPTALAALPTVVSTMSHAIATAAAHGHAGSAVSSQLAACISSPVCAGAGTAPLAGNKRPRDQAKGGSRDTKLARYAEDSDDGRSDGKGSHHSEAEDEDDVSVGNGADDADAGLLGMEDDDKEEEEEEAATKQPSASSRAAALGLASAWGTTTTAATHEICAAIVKECGSKAQLSILQAYAQRNGVTVTEFTSDDARQRYADPSGAYVLVGVCDGRASDGTVLEAKWRTSLKPHPPVKDMMQARAYGKMYGGVNFALVERGHADGWLSLPVERDTRVEWADAANQREWVFLHECFTALAHYVARLTRDQVVAMYHVVTYDTPFGHTPPIAVPAPLARVPPAPRPPRPPHDGRSYVRVAVVTGAGKVVAVPCEGTDGYTLPGGVVGDGESIEHAAVRLVQEQTGLRVPPRALTQVLEVTSETASYELRQGRVTVLAATRPRGPPLRAPATACNYSEMAANAVQVHAWHELSRLMSHAIF